MNVADMLVELTNHGFEDVDTDQKLRVINAAYGDVSSRDPWPQLQRSVVLTFTGSSPTPTNQPADMRAVLNVSRTDRRGSISHMRLDDFQEALGYDAASPGLPMLYYFDGTAIKFYKVPAASDTLVLKYLYAPAELGENSVAADIWLPPRFHRDVLVNGAVYKLYLMEDDVELSREFERLYEKALTNMRYDLLTRHFEGDFIHVPDYTDWDYD